MKKWLLRTREYDMVEKRYPASEAFHDKYGHLYDRDVVVLMKDGRIIKGIFNDEFYEDESIMIDCCAEDKIEIIKISEIAHME